MRAAAKAKEYGYVTPKPAPAQPPLERYRESGGFIVGYDGVPLVGEEIVDKLNELLDAATRTIRAEEALKAAKVAYSMDLAKHEEKLRFERERINRVSALLKQRGYAPIDGAVGAYAEGLVAVFRDLDEAHARAERAESEFRGVARRLA